MQEFSYELKIPKERVAVLIGTRGKMRRQIEQLTKSSLKVDSQEGDVFISGEDALGLYTAKEIVMSIGRGFNPEVAMLLTKPEYVYEQFNLNDFAKSKKHMMRVKGRVIGQEGKARRLIEDLSECHICVYGKTISIIGETELVPLARKAIESLLSGSPHSNVYNWLEKQRRKLKEKRILESV